MRGEPARCSDADSLWPPFRTRVEALLARMTSRGFDPVVFEAKRSPERQKWLHSIGRTQQRARKPVTWTLKSRHLVGKAADIISRSRGWDWPEFFLVLREEAAKLGLTVLKQEACHVQWGL